MCNHFFKSIIMLLILSLTVLSTAFAISVTTPEQLVEVLGQTEVGLIELGADIEIERMDIAVSYASRYINLNGHTLTLSDTSYIDFDGDDCSLEFYDNSDLGKLVFNDSGSFYVNYISDATGCTIVFNGGSYIRNNKQTMFIARYSDQQALMNFVIKKATFYSIGGSPFNTDSATYDIQNMNVMPLNNTGESIGFANIYKYINEVMPASRFIFQNGELCTEDRATTYVRDLYIKGSNGNNDMIVGEQTELISGEMTIPTFDAVHEGYGTVPYQSFEVTINDEEAYLDTSKFKIVLMGHLKNCFDINQPSGGAMEGIGTWELGGIRPKVGLPSGQYNVPVKLVYDKDDDGTYESIIGTGTVYFEVFAPEVKLLNYWGTSGPYASQVIVDGHDVSSVQAENNISLIPGEEVSVKIENVEHYENYAGFLYYNSDSHDTFELELGEDGFMHGSFIVPNYDFAIGLGSRLLDVKIEYYSNNNQNLSETYYYALGDDGVDVTINDNTFGYEKEDYFFTSWSINSSGSTAPQYTRAQVVHFDRAESKYLYANWQYMEDIPNIELNDNLVTWDAYDEDFIAGLHGYIYEYCVESDTDEKIFDSDTTSINLKDICEELGKASGKYEFDIYARVKNSYRISNIYHAEYQYEANQILGDLNNDGEISIIDVRLLLQAYINSTSSTVWTQEELNVMDMDDNEKVNIIDVRLLLQAYINS